jgi:hypothetical protein
MKCKLTVTFDLDKDYEYMMERLCKWIKGDLDVYVGLENLVVTPEIIDRNE